MKRFKFGWNKEPGKDKEIKKKIIPIAWLELISLNSSKKRPKIFYFDNLAYGNGLKNV